MAQNFRQTEILLRAREHGKVVVEDLARHYDVTLQTIRRDLTEMSGAGLLTRVYGGAVLASGVANIGYEDRRRSTPPRRTASAGSARPRSRTAPRSSSTSAPPPRPSPAPSPATATSWW